MDQDDASRRTPQASLEGMSLRSLRSQLKHFGTEERAAHDPEEPPFTLYNQWARRGEHMVPAPQFVLEFVRSSNSTRSGGSGSRRSKRARGRGDQ